MPRKDHASPPKDARTRYGRTQDRTGQEDSRGDRRPYKAPRAPVRQLKDEVLFY